MPRLKRLSKCQSGLLGRRLPGGFVRSCTLVPCGYVVYIRRYNAMYNADVATVARVAVCGSDRSGPREAVLPGYEPA